MSKTRIRNLPSVSCLLSLILLSACGLTPPAQPISTATPTEDSFRNFTPVPTSINTPTPTSTITPSPIPIPWSLYAAINSLPEVYTNSVAPRTIDLYKSLLTKLPTEVQKWITGIGWGLEDLVLDNNEITLLNLLADKNKDTSLSVLTRPEIIDGISSNELAWVKKYQGGNLPELLQDDIDELRAQELLSDKGLTCITEYLKIADSNYEMAKGFYIIDNYGLSNPRSFAYKVPAYNVQLFFLGRLLELGIPKGYEVAAIAASLDYGTLWVIADDDLRALLPQYALNMILFQSQTDLVLMQSGASWQAKNYPLEAQIALVWGAPGNYFPLTQEEANRIRLDIAPNKSWAGYREVFFGRQMSLSDWKFVSIELSTLEDMKDYLSKQGYLSFIPERIANQIFTKYMDNIDYQWSPEVKEIDGRSIYNTYICNPDWQWKQVKSSGDYQGRAIGSSGDAYFHTFILKSINLSGITPAYIVHQSGYFDFASNSWKASSSELRISSDHQLDTRFGWNKVPFDNYWLPPITGNFSGRPNILFPANPFVVWQKGLPVGYIFRSDMSSEPFPRVP